MEQFLENQELGQIRITWRIFKAYTHTSDSDFHSGSLTFSTPGVCNLKKINIFDTQHHPISQIMGIPGLGFMLPNLELKYYGIPHSTKIIRKGNVFTTNDRRGLQRGVGPKNQGCSCPRIVVHSRIHTPKVGLEVDRQCLQGWKVSFTSHLYPSLLFSETTSKKTSIINIVICKCFLHAIVSLDSFLLKNGENMSNSENILVSLRDHLLKWRRTWKISKPEMPI